MKKRADDGIKIGKVQGDVTISQSQSGGTTGNQVSGEPPHPRSWTFWTLICTVIVTIVGVLTYFDLTPVKFFPLREERPLINVTPVRIWHPYDDTQAQTNFSIVNSSEFRAYMIGVDLKYGGNSWILEWRKARDGIVPGLPIKELGPGKRTDLGIIGALNLERNVCDKGDQGFPVTVRVTWQNVNGHVFDEVHKYRLICTKDTEQGDPARGRSFTFIPEGIMAQKK